MTGIEPRAAITADEKDAYGPGRRALACYSRAGVARKVKTATNRRERRDRRKANRAFLADHAD